MDPIDLKLILILILSCMLIIKLCFYWIVGFVDYCNMVQLKHVVNNIMNSSLRILSNFWKISSYLVQICL